MSRALHLLPSIHGKGSSRHGERKNQANAGHRSRKYMTKKTLGRLGLGVAVWKIRLEGHLWHRKRGYDNYKALHLHLRKPVKRKKIKRAHLATLAATCISGDWSIAFLSYTVMRTTKLVSSQPQG